MGLFGFGKKKHQSKEALEAAAGENEEAVDAAENVDEAQEVVALPEPSAEYEGRGDEHGPWDVEDENVPDYDEYLDMGSYYLPFLKGIELRVKANRATQQVLGTTITYGSSSVEIEAFAAPKTLGLWDDVDFDALLDLACAVEVFQTGALVHDDIIDDSDLRRGKPSAHRAFSTGTHSEAIGHGLGIMLGDMLATASVDIADKVASKLTHGSDVVAALLNMHREVEVGQVLDLAVELNPLDDPDELVEASLNVFRWKTASYTTIAPLEFGMLAAGIGKDDARKQALAVGLPLGLAFQLADDLLDVVGSSSNTGKPVGGDIREGKRTVLLADAINAANDTQRRELIDMWEADSRSETQVKRAIELFEQTGAIERSRGRIADLWNESKTAIETLSLSEYHESLLIEACSRFVPSIHVQTRA